MTKYEINSEEMKKAFVDLSNINKYTQKTSVESIQKMFSSKEYLETQSESIRKEYALINGLFTDLSNSVTYMFLNQLEQDGIKEIPHLYLQNLIFDNLLTCIKIEEFKHFNMLSFVSLASMFSKMFVEIVLINISRK